MTEEWTLNLPDDVSEVLEQMDDDRVAQVVSDALREALGLAETAEERRDELRERMGHTGQSAEELAEDSTEEPETGAKKKRAELRERITEGR